MGGCKEVDSDPAISPQENFKTDCFLFHFFNKSFVLITGAAYYYFLSV